MEPDIEIEPEFYILNDSTYRKSHNTRERIWNKMLVRREQFIKTIKNISNNELNDFYVELIVRDDSKRVNTEYLPSGKFKLFYKKKLKTFIIIKFPIIQPLFIQIIETIIRKPLVFNMYFETIIYNKMINQPWIANLPLVTVIIDEPLQKQNFEHLLLTNKDNRFKVMNAFIDLILKFKNVHGFLIFAQDEIKPHPNFYYLFKNKEEKKFIDPFDIELYGKKTISHAYGYEVDLIDPKENYFLKDISFKIKPTLWVSNLLIFSNKDIRFFIKSIPDEYQKIIDETGGWEENNIYTNFPKKFDVKIGQSPYGEIITMEIIRAGFRERYHRLAGQLTDNSNGFTLTFMVELIFLVLYNIRLKNSNWFDRKPFQESFSSERKDYWLKVIKMLNYFIIIIIQYIQENLLTQYKTGLKYDKEYVFKKILENIKKITNNDFDNYYDNPSLDLLMIYVPLKVFISRNSIVLESYQNDYGYHNYLNPRFLQKYCIDIHGEIPLVEMIINCDNPEDYTFEEILRKNLLEEVEKKKRKREGKDDSDDNSDDDDDDSDDDNGQKKKKRRLQFKIGTNYYHFGKKLFF